MTKYRKTEINTYILSDHGGIKLEIHSKRKTEHAQAHGVWTTYYWTMNVPLKKETKKESEEQMKGKHKIQKPMGYKESNPKRQTYSYMGLH